MKPLVSICIPTYNGSQFIAEAIDSVINQTYSNLEIIVSDDASTDNTLAIIESYKSKTNIPIRIFKHEPKGIGANWNYCLEQALGTYIKFLFQDDVLEPTCVEKLVAILEDQAHIGLVASKRYIIDADSKPVEKDSLWMQKYGDLQRTLSFEVGSNLCVISRKIFKWEPFFEEPINKIGEPSAVLFRSSVIKTIGFFREDLHQMLDFEFYYRLLKKWDIAIINEKLAKFRMHEVQATNLNVKKGIINKDLIVYNKIIYKDFFWYLNTAKKIELLKKYHPIFKLIFKNPSVC